ncbi:MAG: hypothetical protein L6R35_006907 [Caloplaca aegaea]|nr:MAG: hypothetical protein L6R35_006907 [Caloplaca aegaea]
MPLGPIKGRKYQISIFTGLIVDHLKKMYGLVVEYEILEANGNNRLGGRLYTRIDNLAQLHSSSKAEYDEVREIIEKNYQTHFAYDWYAHPGITGAFAYFGPGLFKNMYPYIICNNGGTHIIIGEAS